jgi:hypothetical protein
MQVVTKIYLMTEEERREHKYATGLVLKTADGQIWLQCSTDVIRAYDSCLIDLPAEEQTK